MKRSEIRESIFILLFSSMFHGASDAAGQVERFLSGMADGEFEELLSGRPNAKDTAYIREKLTAVTEHLPEIDALLNEVSEGWSTARMSKADLSLLRLAVYEIRYDDDIPTGVAINEAVELAKKYGGENTSAFVNGILGKVAGGA